MITDLGLYEGLDTITAGQPQPERPALWLKLQDKAKERTT